MEATGTGGGVRPGLILGICCVSLGLTGLDTTIVNVALPSMGRDMLAQVSGLQWIVAGYTIALTSCLLSSDGLADRFGPRRIFLAGGYAHAGPPAWWVTAAFGATIIPLALAAARPSTSASRRRTPPLPAAAAPAALGGLVMAAGPQLPGPSSRAGILLARGWPLRWPRSGSADRAAPPLAGPGPAALHHDRRRAQPPSDGSDASDASDASADRAAPQSADDAAPQSADDAAPQSADDAAPQPDAPPLAGPGPAALHHDRRRTQPPGDSPDGAGSEPTAGLATYPVDRSASTLGRAVPEGLPATGNAARTQDSQAVAEALASLSPEHRQVIVETYYRGRSVAQTAAALGIPAATVKARTFDALKALKLALQERI